MKRKNQKHIHVFIINCSVNSELFWDHWVKVEVFSPPPTQHRQDNQSLTLLFTSLSLGRISRPKPSAWPLTLLPPFMWFPRARTSPTTLLTLQLSSNTFQQKSKGQIENVNRNVNASYQYCEAKALIPYRRWRPCRACAGLRWLHRGRLTGRWCSGLCLQSLVSETAHKGTWSVTTSTGRGEIMTTLCITLRLILKMVHRPGAYLLLLQTSVQAINWLAQNPVSRGDTDCSGLSSSLTSSSSDVS